MPYLEMKKFFPILIAVDVSDSGSSLEAVNEATRMLIDEIKKRSDSATDCDFWVSIIALSSTPHTVTQGFLHVDDLLWTDLAAEEGLIDWSQVSNSIDELLKKVYCFERFLYPVIFYFLGNRVISDNDLPRDILFHRDKKLFNNERTRTWVVLTDCNRTDEYLRKLSPLGCGVENIILAQNIDSVARVIIQSIEYDEYDDIIPPDISAPEKSVIELLEKTKEKTHTSGVGKITFL